MQLGFFMPAFGDLGGGQKSAVTCDVELCDINDVVPP